MDSVCADTNLNNVESNNNAMENLGETPTAEPATVNAEQPQTYDDLFPSLPTAVPGKSNPTGPSIGNWNKKPMLSSASITSLFHIPAEERKDQGGHFGAGSAEDSSKLVKTVMEKTGAKIEMASNKDQSLTFVIRGKQETVLKARRELLVQFQTQASVSISVPKDHHKYILGRGGANLQLLEQKTSTKISMPKANESNDKISISGPKEGIDKAIHEIRIISDEQSKQSYEVLAIPKIYHPFISGPNSDNTKAMLNEFPNVRINIPPLSVMKDELSVAGETEGVQAVKAKILKIFKDIVSYYFTTLFLVQFAIMMLFSYFRSPDIWWEFMVWISIQFYNWNVLFLR